MKRALLISLAAAMCTIPTAQAEDVIPRDAATAFVEKQFANFFTNCVAFVRSFDTSFKYCDGAPCTSDAKVLLAQCLLTQGSSNTIHSFTVTPLSTNPALTNYASLGIKGKQSVTFAAGTQAGTTMCFDFIITEELKRVPTTISNPAGLVSKSWIGYYNMTSGSCR